LIGRLDPKVFDTWSASRKLAFWINAYNALTLKLIIDHYPIRTRPFAAVFAPADSIKQIPKRWTAEFFMALGRPMSLDEIEHEILRQRGVDPHERTFDEPRIHVALVCAAVGCPPLRNEPFDAARLAEQFADQARRFLADPKRFRIDREAGVVRLSSIFKWFGADFVSRYLPAEGYGAFDDDVRAPLHYVAGFLPAGQAAWLRAGQYKVRFLPYDWSLNVRDEPIPTTQPEGTADDR